MSDDGVQMMVDNYENIISSLVDKDELENGHKAC